MNQFEKKVPSDHIQPLQADHLPIEDEIDLLDYLLVLVRWRWLIIGGSLLSAVAFFFYTQLFSHTPVYRAEASILSDAQSNVLNMQAAGGQNQGMQIDITRLEILNERVATKLADILEGVSINQRIVQKTYSYTINGKKHNTDLLTFFKAKSLRSGIKTLLKNVKFEAERSLVIITVEMQSPELSAAIANEYIEQLRIFQQEKFEAQLQRQLESIEHRRKELSLTLEQAEETLTQYESNNINFIGNDDRTTFTKPEQAREYAKMKRDVQIRSTLLIEVLKQFETVRLESKRQVSNFDVISYAQPPTARTKTRKLHYILVLVIGGFMFTFLAFILEYITNQKNSEQFSEIALALKSDRERLKRLFKRQT